MTNLYTYFIQTQNKDKIYRQNKLEKLNNAIDSLGKWKDENKHYIMSDDLNRLNNIIDNLTDTFIDFKDNINNEGKV